MLNDNGIKAFQVRKLEQESPNLLDLILGHEIDLVIDNSASGRRQMQGWICNPQNAIETGVTVLTSLDTAAALVTSMENRAKELTLIDIALVKNV